MPGIKPPRCTYSLTAANDNEQEISEAELADMAEMRNEILDELKRDYPSLWPEIAAFNDIKTEEEWREST